MAGRWAMVIWIKMNFEIIANKINYTPDLGYRSMRNNFEKYEWTSHTISHNTFYR